MVQNPSNDRMLRAVEERLAELAPRLSESEQSALLYQCAFAAGRKAAARKASRWRWTSAVLGVLLLGSMIPWLSRRSSEFARHPPDETGRVSEVVEPSEAIDFPEAVQADEEIAQSFDSIVAQELARRASVPDHVRYRGEKVPHDRQAEFAERLAAFERLDPAARAVAVGPLTKALQGSL